MELHQPGQFCTVFAVEVVSGKAIARRKKRRDRKAKLKK